MSSLPETLVQFRSELEDAIGRELAPRPRRGRHRRRTVALVAAALLVAFGTASAFAVRAIVFGNAPASFAPAWSPDGKKIAYVHTGGGDPRVDRGRLYVMNADGSAPRKLGPVACCPAWSPDGSKLVFVAGEIGTDIFVVNPDGSGLRALTRGPAWEGSPTWSPEGRYIAIVKEAGCFRCSPNTELWVMSANGSRRRLLAIGTGIGVATWSPDGRTLVYESSYRPSPNDPKRRYQHITELFRVDLDGSKRQRLTYGEHAEWSPDGTKIAFISRRGRAADLWVMNPDGTGQRRLTHTPGGENEIAWSPDGRRIAVTSGRHYGISVINADGSGMRTFPGDWVDIDLASWSPGGRKILFASDRGGAWEIYVMNADGSRLRNLTQPKGRD